MNFNEIIALDKVDTLAHKRDEFDLPADTIYLDGNSLGALPKAVNLLVQQARTWIHSGLSDSTGD